MCRRRGGGAGEVVRRMFITIDGVGVLGGIDGWEGVGLGLFVGEGEALRSFG